MDKLRTPLIIIICILIVIFGFLAVQTFLKTSPIRTNVLPNKPTSTFTNPNNSSPTSFSGENPSPAPPSTISYVTYNNIPLGFSISHPEDIPPQKQGETMVFSKAGPSQKPETEFFDGLSLTINGGVYSGDFKKVADQKLAEVKDYPTFVSSTGLKALALAGKEAWSFTAETMGKSTYYFIRQEGNRYLEIIDTTIDPTGQGFEDIVSQMLSSLKVD